VLDDVSAFWVQYRINQEPIVAAAAARYPLIPRSYVTIYISSLASIDGNPRVLEYLDAELGLPGRSLVTLDALVKSGVRVRDARCLDVGCSNGALLLAARTLGAGRCVGIDASAARLNSARMVCAGSGIEFLEGDARDELPADFDLVFCVDVLEHVPGWPRAIERIAKALTPAGAAFVSIHNGRHPASVLSEPHYGVPGLTLLPHDEARACWELVRGALGNTLDYEVYEWPTYADLRALAQGLGLAVAPLAAAEWMNVRFWEGHFERRAALEAGVVAALERLPVPHAETQTLLGAVRDYAMLYTRDHERFAQQPESERLDFYLKYYAQPINVLLRRA
jgi:2-polyprenyl-3-methyl-5-hydroxy-6-metoxy-1,4-benzoquinol methylase